MTAVAGTVQAHMQAASSDDAQVTPAPIAAGPDPAQLLLIQDEKMRFTLELEFVEMLANPHYLHCQWSRLAAADVLVMLKRAATNGNLLISAMCLPSALPIFLCPVSCVQFWPNRAISSTPLS
jgi:hypothetical protein